MNIGVLTLFPQLFDPFFDCGIVRRALDARLVRASIIDIRDFTEDRHKVVDDRPFGGGCGMVMKPEPLEKAVRYARARIPDAPVVLMSPQGRRFDQDAAGELASGKGVILVCGRYEGIDERAVMDFMDDEISVGDYVLSGGEVPAMAVIDAVIRLIPGALGNEDSAREDSFVNGLLDHPHYTRPRVFKGEAAPEVLLSGDHAAIRAYREKAALVRTFLKRPDLLETMPLTDGQLKILKGLAGDLERIIRAQSVCGAGASPRDQQDRDP